LKPGIFANRSLMAALLSVLFIGLLVPVDTLPAKRKRLKIIDYRKHLNRRYKKRVRKSTRFIIIHTSEAGLTSTLRTLSRGKHTGKYRTVGGHSNYAIARDGRIYRILKPIYRADHAGLSMWNGIDDLSSHSIGIELVGYHYGNITNQQYSSLTKLLKSLRRSYKVKEKNVLTHSQVSYGRPNIWHKRPHRGRKRCALNFDRRRAGLKGAWNYDPDVRARRLVRDQHIFAMFYKNKKRIQKKQKQMVATLKKVDPPATTISNKPVESSPTGTKPEVITLTPVGPQQTPQISNQTVADSDTFIATNITSNIISNQNTAWNIAGEDYNDSTTLYILPSNKQVRGDQLAQVVGWDRVPTGTKVLLNQPRDIEKKRKGPVFFLTKEYTAWSFAQDKYSKPSTIYFLPNGRVTPGNKMSDWDDMPNGTRMIIGYNGPFRIRSVKGQTPWGIAKRAYNHKDTIYYIPGQGVLTGDNVKDFNDLPNGSSLFLKL
jgi:N-acetylmuramoyl-L-alanine amidase